MASVRRELARQAQGAPSPLFGCADAYPTPPHLAQLKCVVDRPPVLFQTTSRSQPHPTTPG